MKSFYRFFSPVFLLFLCYPSPFLVSACVFTAPKHKKTGIWDTKNYPRKIWAKNGGCSCGTYDPTKTDPSSPKTWLLYVNIFNVPEYPDDRDVCTGTILTSNLVSISHTCLLQFDGDRDRKMQIYETWRPPPKLTSGKPNIVTPDKIVLTAKRYTANGSVYHVKDIILSTRYALSVQASDAPEIQDDIALLVTQENLFEMGHNSVCIPSSSFLNAHKHEKLEDLLYSRLGFYYDSTADFAQTPSGGAKPKNELQKLVILKASDCDKEAGIKEGSTKTALCVRYLGNSLPGYTLGGPLLTYSHGSDASYLLGMAEEANIRPNRKNKFSSYTYTYFTNILSLVKYIDLHANKAESEWCSAKDFELGRKVEINSVDAYPWEGGSFTRNEILDCTCGIRNNPQNKSRAASRIIGGENADPYEFPWMVLLWKEIAPDEFNFCGGSVINDRVILTAAHCLINNQIDQPPHGLVMSIEVNINVHFKDKDDPNKKFYEVSNIYYHPDFVKGGSFNSSGDIALITLKHPIEFSNLKRAGGQKDYRPICIHSNSKDNHPKAGEMAIVAGWGKTATSDSSDELQKLDVPIIPRSKCQGQFDWVTDNHLCAGYFNGNKDNSYGDSGGPLFLPDKTHYAQWGGQFYQVGVVSYGYDVFNSGREDLEVYTNVQKYLDFIDYYSEREGARWCKQP